MNQTNNNDYYYIDENFFKNESTKHRKTDIKNYHFRMNYINYLFEVAPEMMKEMMEGDEFSPEQKLFLKESKISKAYIKELTEVGKIGGQISKSFDRFYDPKYKTPTLKKETYEKNGKTYTEEVEELVREEGEFTICNLMTNEIVEKLAIRSLRNFFNINIELNPYATHVGNGLRISPLPDFVMKDPFVLVEFEIDFFKTREDFDKVKDDYLNEVEFKKSKYITYDKLLKKKSPVVHLKKVWIEEEHKGYYFFYDIGKLYEKMDQLKFEVKWEDIKNLSYKEKQAMNLNQKDINTLKVNERSIRTFFKDIPEDCVTAIEIDGDGKYMNFNKFVESMKSYNKFIENKNKEKTLDDILGDAESKVDKTVKTNDDRDMER